MTEPERKRRGRPRLYPDPKVAARVRRAEFRARRRAEGERLGRELLGIIEGHDLTEQERKTLQDAARLLGKLEL